MTAERFRDRRFGIRADRAVWYVNDIPALGGQLRVAPDIARADLLYAVTDRLRSFPELTALVSSSAGWSGTGSGPRIGGERRIGPIYRQFLGEEMRRAGAAGASARAA